jgi:hypothetical protein
MANLGMTGSVVVELIGAGEGFLVTASTVGYSSKKFHRYDDATKEAFSHAREFAKINSCVYTVEDRRYEESTVIDGTPITMEEITAAVDVMPHREFVLAVLAQKFLGRSKIDVDLAAEAKVARTQQHPTGDRLSTLRLYVSRDRDFAAKHEYPETVARIARRESIIDGLSGQHWDDYIAAADAEIYAENH